MLGSAKHYIKLCIIMLVKNIGANFFNKNPPTSVGGFVFFIDCYCHLEQSCLMK